VYLSPEAGLLASAMLSDCVCVVVVVVVVVLVVVVLVYTLLAHPN